METSNKIATLKSLINSLEQKRLAGEIDERLWRRMSFTKANTQNTSQLERARMMNSITDSELEIAREMLAEVDKPDEKPVK